MKTYLPCRFPAVPCILLLILLCSGERAMPGFEENAADDRCCRIMFYNVENLFDIYDDSLTRDEEFTPAGNMHWTRNRYEAKLKGIAKVIVASGGWLPADIIGLCEVENRPVLEDLTRNTILSKTGYRIVHKDSEDPRGIDVALLYNSHTVSMLDTRFYSPGGEKLKTRDILHMKAILCGDTCHIFVNHWPSRSGGQLETEPARKAVAALLKEKTDSLLLVSPRSRLIIMGDFNDEAGDVSLSVVLGAKDMAEGIEVPHLYNLSAVEGHTGGTLKYQGQWSLFDQILVSGSYLVPNTGSRAGRDGFRIIAEDFLLEEDLTYNGMKPYRTYLGYRYLGGLSDHLPVCLDLYR